MPVIVIVFASVSCSKDEGEDKQEKPDTNTIEYTLALGDIPSNFDGGETTVTVVMTTNVPVADLVTETPDWIMATVKEGALTVVISANRTVDEREGEVALKDTRNRVKAVSFHVTQDWLLINGEGMVQFRDKAFKKAILAVADNDKDLDISMEEAKTIREVNAVGKGIVDIAGIECFSSIERIDLRDNDIRRVWLDDPAVYSNLRYIDLTGNMTLANEINLSGCYAGKSIYLAVDNLLSHTIKTKEPSFYESTDFTYNGLHEIKGHTKGNGIPLVFITTAYVDLDYKNGAVRELVEYQAEQLFSVEPFSSMEDYFDISYLAFVAPNDQERADTPSSFEQYWDDLKIRFRIYFNTDGDNGRANAGLLVLSSHYMYLPGIVRLTEQRQVCHIEKGSDYTLPHEMGHALGGLEDEYEEEREHSDYATLNFTKDISRIPWQRFLDHENYKDRVGIYPRNGGYVPSENSMMGDPFETPVFNSPSRYAIFRNILFFSTFDWETSWKYPDYWEEFLEYDKINDSLPI
jgi:hypothetical protein